MANTALPNSIAANIGQVGGAPDNAEATSAYLTQLAGSLNGFTGPVSNAINYLLAQSQQPNPNSRAAAYGAISGLTLNASYCAWGLGASGARLTPSATGRVICFASGNWNPQMSGAGNALVSSQFYLGQGTAPAQGATVPAGAIAMTVPAQVVGITQGTYSAAQNFWMTVFSVGFLLGLSTSTSYWVDVFSLGGGSTTGVIEWGQCLYLEV